MTNQDMVVSYVFDINTLKIGGFYRINCGNWSETNGVLTSISPNKLVFYIPVKDTELSSHLEPREIEATNFYNDENAYIVELA